MFEYFYNEILRRTIIGFGTLFNGISIKQDGSPLRVPLAYGPTQKFLARLTQSPDLNKATSLSLPRMSFEFTGLTYDPSRKVTTTQKIVVQNPDSDTPDEKKVYMPVPYNMQFELAVMCKLNDDALQIVEQILPYFQPSYNLTINLISSIGEKRDVPVVLDSVSFTDDYEGMQSNGNSKEYSNEHPIVRTHPETEKKILFVNWTYTKKIIGLDDKESKEILEKVFEHQSRLDLTCRFRWTENAVAIWDNRSVQHYAISDFFPGRGLGYERVMDRIAIEGDRPN